MNVVAYFKYLGAYNSSDGTNAKELNYRLGKAAGVFRELDKIWKNRYINLPTKMQFYNACATSTLLYGAEYRTLKDKDENRFDAFDMWCQRKILKTRWSHHVGDIDTRKKTNQPQLSNIIKKRRLHWFGHAPAVHGCYWITTEAMLMGSPPWTKKG